MIKNILNEFSEMHDYGKKDVGYQPSIPSEAKLMELKGLLMVT